MVVYKTWKVYSKGYYRTALYLYRGWFLFGIIPIFIIRVNL